MSDTSSADVLAQFLKEIKERDTPKSQTSILQQIAHSSEPCAAAVSLFLQNIKQSPESYEGLRKKLQEILLEEKKEVEQAIEDLLDLQFELEEEEDEKVTHRSARELEWLDKDLTNAQHEISDVIKRKRDYHQTGR